MESGLCQSHMQEGNKVHILKNDQWHAARPFCSRCRLISAQIHSSDVASFLHPAYLGLSSFPVLQLTLHPSAPHAFPFLPLPPAQGQSHPQLFLPPVPRTMCYSSQPPPPPKVSVSLLSLENIKTQHPQMHTTPGSGNLPTCLFSLPVHVPGHEESWVPHCSWRDWKPHFRSLATPNINFAPLFVAGKLGPQGNSLESGKPSKDFTCLWWGLDAHSLVELIYM